MKSRVTSIGLIPISVLPALLQDIIDETDKWGNDGENGRIDPFTEINDVSLLFLLGQVMDLRAQFYLSSLFS